MTEEEKFQELGIAMDQAIGAGDIKSAARETESKLYDGPLTAKDIPEQIKKELHEFFET